METCLYVHLPVGRPPPATGVDGPFKAVVVSEQAARAEWRSQVSDWLVNSGCLYLMTWGLDCELWEDAADHARDSAVNFNDMPDDEFLMTTSHGTEPLSETLWFAMHSATHPTMALDRTVIVHVAAEPREIELVDALRDAERRPY